MKSILIASVAIAVLTAGSLAVTGSVFDRGSGEVRDPSSTASISTSGSNRGPQNVRQSYHCKHHDKRKQHGDADQAEAREERTN